MTPESWVIMPFIDNPAMTLTAVEDCLHQTVPCRVLLIDQGSSQETREQIDAYIDTPEMSHPRVLCWHALPAFPSLSAAWNRALEFVWELGGAEALVVNNDVRLHKETYDTLLWVHAKTCALFVSAVGVREGQYDPALDLSQMSYCTPVDGTDVEDSIISRPTSPGGPDFSCFLLSKEGHLKYPFDESFQPAYCEDLDQHRRYMLGGDGARIFSINLPFLHIASGTLKSYSPAQKAKFDRAYAGVVARYTTLWGGGPNQETYTRKGDPASAQAGVTTPELQRKVQAGEDLGILSAPAGEGV